MISFYIYIQIYIDDKIYKEINLFSKRKLILYALFVYKCKVVFTVCKEQVSALTSCKSIGAI